MKSKQPLSRYHHNAARCLREQKNEILSRWEKRARQALPIAALQKHYFLIDSLPHFIDELVSSLQQGKSKRARAKEVAESHAIQRLALLGYTLDQVQEEYTLLRQVLFEVLEESGKLDSNDRDIVLDLIVEGRMAAAAEYMRLYHQKVTVSEEHLSLALESAQMGIFHWDLKSGKLRWSDTLQILWGYQKGEFSETMESFWARIHPQDRSQVQTAIENSLIHRQDFRSEYRVVWPDKSTHWIYARGRTYFDLQGNPDRMSGTATEITDRKKMESALQLSEQKFRRIYESNMVGLAFANTNGEIYEANDYFLKLVGYSREDFHQLKLNWIDLTPPEYLHLDQKAIEEMKQIGTCQPFEKPYRRRDGKLVWIMITAAFIDPENFNHISLAIDITQQRQTQEALKESERQLRLVTNSIPQIIWTATPDGASEHYNQNWYNYTGLKLEEGHGMHWQGVVHPEDLTQNLQVWQRAQLTGETYVVEHRLRRSDGIYRWFLTRAEPLRDSHGKIIQWFGTSTDIDDQKQIQKTLEQERELREQFVNTLSHDLRNPLSAAKMSAEMIARNPQAFEKSARLALKMGKDIERVDKMIQDLLDVSRIRAGKAYPIELSECDLSEIAEKVCDELHVIHGIHVNRKFPMSLKGYWSCKDIQRMLENLLTNAIKYGDSEKKLTVAGAELGDAVELSIHNFGNPIPPEEQKRLFDPFVRSSSAETGNQKGWGLGLTFVKGIAEAHGGKVEVESNPEKGTTFTVLLPKNQKN